MVVKIIDSIRNFSPQTKLQTLAVVTGLSATIITLIFLLTLYISNNIRGTAINDAPRTSKELLEARGISQSNSRQAAMNQGQPATQSKAGTDGQTKSTNQTSSSSPTVTQGQPISQNTANSSEQKSDSTAANTACVSQTQLSIFDVGCYGAFGDSHTDNLAAFNAAAKASLSKNPAVIRVPAGKYYISDTLLIDHPNITLDMTSGAEIFSTKLTTLGATVAFVGYYGKTSNTSSTPQQNSATIKGGSVWNSNPANSNLDNALGFTRYKTAVVDGTNVTRCTRKGVTGQYGIDKFYIRNLQISNCLFAGITLETDIKFTQISNVKISTVGVGIIGETLTLARPVGEVLIGSTSVSDTKQRGISITTYSSLQIETVAVSNASISSKGSYDAIYLANGQAAKIRDTKVTGTYHRYALWIIGGAYYLRSPYQFNPGVSGTYGPNTPTPQVW